MKRNTRVLKTPSELENYVLEEYHMYDTELNSLHFDVQVCMKEREILEAYRNVK